MRRPSALSVPQFWAEDGQIYFHDQAVYGPWGALQRPYNGYLTVVQRLIALFASPFPARIAPVVYTLAGAGVDAFCSAVFFLPWFRRLLENDRLRFACCLLMATSIYMQEVVGTMANLQWFLLVASITLLFRDLPVRQERRWIQLCWLLAGVIIGLTVSLLVIIIPFAVWRLIRKRDGTGGYEVGLIFGLVVQILVFVNTETVVANVTITNGWRILDLVLSSAIVSLLYRGFLSTLVGTKTAYDFANGGWLGAPQLALIALTLGLTTLWWHSTRREQLVQGIAIGLALCQIAIALQVRDLTRLFANIQSYPEWSSERYFVLPACVCIYLTAAAISKLVRSNSGWRPVAVLACCFAIGVAQNFSCRPLKDMHWRDYASAVDESVRSMRTAGPLPVRVPINPENWTVALP